MVDELPAGFSIITEGSPEWQALSTASGSSLQRGWVASADQTNLAPGATRYELPFPQLRQSPKMVAVFIKRSQQK